MAKPLLFITGFLGAGKTSLLRSLLEQLGAEGKRADVILNDFANADLDAATLDASTTSSIAPIAASCACCDSLDELVSLCSTASKGLGDLLLVELNGTADPLSLLEAFTLLEERLSFFPRLQVCVVDARYWGARGDFTPLEQRQMETAGYWLLSHTEQVGDSRIAAIKDEIEKSASHAVEVTAKKLAGVLASGGGSH